MEPSRLPHPEVRVDEAEDLDRKPGAIWHVEAIVSPDGGDEIKKSGPGRKSRACAECRKQKMRCEVLPGDRKCRHCLRRKIDCIMKRVVESDAGPRPTPSLSEDYEKKLELMSDEIRRMRETLGSLLQQGAQIHLPKQTDSLSPATGLQNATSPMQETSPAKTVMSCAREDNMHMAMTRENSLEPGGSGEQGVTVEEPMGSLYEVTRLRNIRSNRAKTARPLPESQGELNDFISRGVISEAEAEELYKVFHATLNHYLWVGLEQTHASFNSVRKSSELLTATILTVTALHIPTSAETFDNCYKEFLSLISSSMFSRYHSLDDVRGLCIAAFWLSEVSWKLSGHAIRIATELNIHQSFTRALEGDRDHFLRARLWYMLYVCDHHFSIAYGRPPMIAESLQIREHEQFLSSPFADALDYRILSQVHLMQILTRVYDRFGERRIASPVQLELTAHGHAPHGSNTSTTMLSEGDFADLRNFNLDIDQWRMRWHTRQVTNTCIGTFPPKGIILYSYFAKLQLNSLAVRGVSLSQGRLSTERKEFANMAISAAASILTFVLEEEDLRRALVGTPLYVHTMIAFASVFLMKVTTKWNRIMGLNVEFDYVAHLLERMIVLLKSSITSDRHLLYHIAAGLEKMLGNMVKPPAPKSEPKTEAEEATGPPTVTLAEYDSTPYADGSVMLHETDTPRWEAYPNAANGVVPGQTYFGDLTIMNDSVIFEAFGSESSNDVYNLLTSQFSC